MTHNKPIVSILPDSEEIKVCVNVSAHHYFNAYDEMRDIMQDSYQYDMIQEGRASEDDFVSEEEMKLLCAVLQTVADRLPIETYEYLNWAKLTRCKEWGYPEFVADSLVTDQGLVFAEMTDDDLLRLAESASEEVAKRHEAKPKGRKKKAA